MKLNKETKCAKCGENSFDVDNKECKCHNGFYRFRFEKDDSSADCYSKLCHTFPLGKIQSLLQELLRSFTFTLGFSKKISLSL